MAIDHAAVIDAAGPIRRVIQPVDLPAGWDPAAVGIARRAASPIAFRRARAAETRRGERDDAIGGTDAPVFQELWEMVGRLEQRAARLTPRPDRLRQLGKLIVQLQTLLRRARPLTLSDPGE